MNKLALTTDSPLLVSYAFTLRAQALSNRARTKRLIDQDHEIVSKLLNDFSDKTKQLARLRNANRVRQKGITHNETMSEIQPEEGLTVPISDAERFLLKKAYRMAASLTHPDKGGNKEDFQYVTAAYKANDLGALTEFVLSTGSVTDQITYWQNECQKPDIEWRSFQSTLEHKAAQLYMCGQHAKAYHLVERVLDTAIVAALNESFM